MSSIKTFFTLQRAVIIAAFLSIGTGAACAHHLWLEPTANGGASLYFGEFGGNLRETSPGLLDKFVKPAAHKIKGGEAKPLSLAKRAQAFELAEGIAARESLVVEDTSYPISERKQGDQLVRSLYQPAARLVVDGSVQLARLTLDLVPTGKAAKEGIELKASYKGQPLAKAKVEVLTPSGWMRELRTAEDGTLHVPMPWQGIYVMEMSHSDAAGGERGGQKYDKASYVTSLTVMRGEGLPALPAAPAATPNTAH